jgi:hypothetical protein
VTKLRPCPVHIVKKQGTYVSILRKIAGRIVRRDLPTIKLVLQVELHHVATECHRACCSDVRIDACNSRHKKIRLREVEQARIDECRDRRRSIDFYGPINFFGSWRTRDWIHQYLPPSPVVNWQTSPVPVQWASGKSGEAPGTVTFLWRMLGIFSYQMSASLENCGDSYQVAFATSVWIHPYGRLTVLMMKIFGVTMPERFVCDHGVDVRDSTFATGDRPYFVSFRPGEKRAADAVIRLTNNNVDSSILKIGQM